jgi:predicted GIY-YIG superfamily endonuclease
MAYLYLIELAAPLPGTNARFYLGSTNDLARRLEQHRTGKGSPMLRRALELGIPYKSITWRAYCYEARARRTEARLKRWHSNTRARAYMLKNGAKTIAEAPPAAPFNPW